MAQKVLHPAVCGDGTWAWPAVAGLPLLPFCTRTWKPVSSVRGQPNEGSADDVALSSCLSLGVRAKSCSASAFGTGAWDLLLQLAVVSEERLGTSRLAAD